jgi:hypothetical protein
MKSFIFLVISGLLCIWPMWDTAEAIPITGTYTPFFHELQGTVSSIEVNIGGTSYSTGPITYTLDLINPLNSFEVFNFDTLTVREEADFLITCPLFDTLGIAPEKVHAVETGTFSILSPIDPEPGEHFFNIETNMGGSLVVPPGSIFSGWTWTNRTKQSVGGYGKINPDGSTEVGVCWRKEKGSDGIVTDPSGTIQDVTFDGTGRLCPKPVPEPATLLLLGSGLAGFCWSRKKKAI